MIMIFIFLISSVVFFAMYLNNKKKYKAILLLNKNCEKNEASNYDRFLAEELERQCNELAEKDKKIQFLLYHDNLTKLYNNTYLMEKLEELNSSKDGTEEFVLFFINIDNFKNVNAVHGYDYGDKILLLVSEVLKIVLPPDCVLCKWHGDEFFIIWENLKHSEEVNVIAEGVIDSFSKPFEIGEKQIYITISIGINIYIKGSCKVNDIVKNAEMAMFKSKKNGRNKYSFYENELQDNFFRKNNIRKYIGNSIYNNEMYINYQPQYDLVSRNIIGYEALLRWNNEQIGQVPPMEFIPIAEENGLIFTLGNWVLRNACIQNSKWIQQGFNNIMAVNISALQFEQDNFVQIVKDVLEETKLPAEFLELEITETVLIKSLEKSIKTIRKLKKLNVKVSLDDFGTGYSSLNYLKRLPLDKVKIDKTFIDDIALSQNSKSILQSIVELAHTINLEVIAEGIETNEQNKILNEMNCDIGQGYYYSKPISSIEVEKILKNSCKYR